MSHEFRLFPEQASSAASKVDALYLYLMIVASFFTLAIFVAITFLAIYYRRGAPRDRSRNHPEKSLMLEVVWIAVPFVLTMVMFFWGAQGIF